ncbi:unnamed protein product [Arabidopsis halleri]
MFLTSYFSVRANIGNETFLKIQSFVSMTKKTILKETLYLVLDKRRLNNGP